MAEGRNPILVAWVALTGLAAVAGGAVLLAPVSETASSLGIAGAITLLFSLLMLPFASRLDRFVASWHEHADTVARGRDTETPRVPPVLRPLVEPLNRALDALRRRGHDIDSARAEAETRLTIAKADGLIVGAALDQVRDGVVVTGATDEVRMLNRAAAELLGTDPIRARYRTLKAIADPRLAEIVGRLTSGPPLEQSIELALDETSRVCDVRVSGLRDECDELIAKITVLREGTGSTNADMSAEFVSHVSHELRTPLTTIRAYVEMLLDGDFSDDDTRTSCYETILEEADRLARLIENMLKLSRLEAGGADIERRPVDVGTLITRAARFIELDADAKNIEVETSLPGDALVAHGDADMLYQVVLNLASNAVKYTRPGGCILLEAHADPMARNIVVSVRDSGLGVPAEDAPFLFDKFYRIKSHRRAADGTGLGLCLCKHIVESVHGGRISVRSTIGVGSEFSFTIPAWITGLKAAA